MSTGARSFDAVDRAVLEFERTGHWTIPGRKDAEIWSRFSMSPTSYYVRLLWILNQPEAMAYDAATVTRLQRLAERRRQVRTRGTVAAGVETRPDVRGVRPAMLGGAVR